MTTLNAPPQSSRVLVVDDDPMMRLMIREALTQAGFAVAEAESGTAALASISRQRPDVVLLDVLMPGINGFIVCEELRRQPANIDLPILMVTGLDDTESIRRAFAIGATDFITKPINWPTLGHHVQYLLRSSRAFADLRQNEKRLANAQRIARLGHWEWDIKSDRLFWSDQVYSIFGVQAETFSASYETCLQAIHPEDRQTVEAQVQRALRGEGSYDIEHRIVLPDGAVRHVHARGEVTFDTAGLAVRMAGSVQDITERKEVEEKLLLAGKVFENCSEMIAVTDLCSRIVDVNPAFSRLSGYSPDELIGEKISILKAEQYDADFYRRHWENLASSGHWHGELVCRTKAGTHLPLLSSISAIRNEKKDATHYVSISTDISRLKEAEERLRHLAYFDPLTELPNRTLFGDRLQQAIHEAKRGNASVAVLLLDLDHFKDINDTLGRHLGDLLLKDVAARLASYVRQCDSLASLGGGAFAILEKGVATPEHAIPLVQKIMAELSSPIRIEGRELYVTASVGIALCPADGTEGEELLKKAETAMYQAKKEGRARYRFFSEELNTHLQERLSLQTRMRQALDREEFLVHYQPKIDLRTGRMTGMEALLRWQQPEQGFVSPAQFIPLAEETGLIVPIGEKVLRMACAQNRQWQAAGLPPQRVAVNFSARQFQEGDLPEMVRQVLDETGLAPHWLEMEITESTLMHQAEMVDAMLQRLKGMGISIALDDFGTGYSSLSYLRRFPIDALKIDQSFVRDILTDRDAATIARTIIAMARSLQLKTIAEGVETEEQRSFLKEQGCDAAQGYLFARPLPPGELADFLAGEEERLS